VRKEKILSVEFHVNKGDTGREITFKVIFSGVVLEKAHGCELPELANVCL